MESGDVHKRRDNVMPLPSASGRETAVPTDERRRRIAMLAPPWIPIPPPGYGGNEFVLALLCDAPHPESIERALFGADHVARAFEVIDLLDMCTSFSDYRLPELFAGFSRSDYEDPVPYPVACSPQAWAAWSLPWMLRAGLGIAPEGLRGALRIRRPSLARHLGPAGLERVGSPA